jgi:hypothetical protein
LKYLSTKGEKCNLLCTSFAVSIHIGLLSRIVCWWRAQYSFSTESVIDSKDDVHVANFREAGLAPRTSSENI